MRHTISAGLSVILLASGFALAQGPVESVGKWLESEAGKGTVTKWQTSDLTYDPHNKCLWSIADQRGQVTLPDVTTPYAHTKHVFQISIPADKSKAPIAHPVEIWFQPDELKVVEKVLASEWALGLDFEGLVAGSTKNMFYACTEGTNPLLLRMEFVGNSQMHVRHAVRLSRRDGRDDADDGIINNRWEGLTINKAGTRLFLAAERQKTDNKPRLYTLLVSDFEKAPSLVNDPHSEVEPVALKDVRLPGAQISALQYVPSPDPSHPGFLLALNRDPDEKTFIVDLAYLRFEPRAVNLDLYAPGDRDSGNFKTNGMSPEGLAVDVKNNRVWLINDPVAAYYAVPAGAGDKRFEDEVPMLFEFDLKKLIP